MDSKERGFFDIAFLLEHEEIYTNSKRSAWE